MIPRSSENTVVAIEVRRDVWQRFLEEVQKRQVSETTMFSVLMDAYDALPEPALDA